MIMRITPDTARGLVVVSLTTDDARTPAMAVGDGDGFAIDLFQADLISEVRVRRARTRRTGIRTDGALRGVPQTWTRSSRK